MCMCMACVCSHVCYAHCVKMCTHVCKHGCGFSELTLCVFFFFITLSIVVKQYVLSNLDFTKSRHSCQQACLGDLSLCCWRAANAGSHPPTHTLPGYIHGSWQSEMWVLVLAQQGLHLLVISTDIFSNTFLLPPPAITYCFSPCQNCSKVLAKCWLVQLKHLPLEIFLSGENNFFLLVVGHIGLWLLL